MFDRVFKCIETKYPNTLVKSVMQCSYYFINDHARENLKYRVSMESHEGFSLQSAAGLLVSTKFPFLGASLDGIIHCSCYGTWLLETYA